MQALLLATGETQKLRPLPECIPSPMIPVMNRPIMAYNLELLGRLGFKDILVSVCSRPESIEQYFGDGQKWGLKLTYIHQEEALGSAGTLLWAKSLLKEPFIVMPADEIADFDLGLAIRLHTTRSPIATVIVQSGFQDKIRALQVDKKGYIRAIGGDPHSGLSRRDTGIYFFDPCVLDLIPSFHPCDIHRHLLTKLLANGIPVQACSLIGYWNNLETIQQYAEAQQVFLANANEADHASEEEIRYRYSTLSSRQLAPGIWVGRNVKVHPSVKIDPPVNIGYNSWIEREVELGPGVVIGSNVVVDQGASIQFSTIFNETYVGKLVFLHERLVCQDQLINLWTGENIEVADPFLLAKANPQHIAAGFIRPLEIILAGFLLLVSLPLTLTLGIVLALTTGRVFKRIPFGSPHPQYLEPPTREIETIHLLNFNTVKADGGQDRFGRWVESWEGQRLPELFNVLKGERSITGPRPALEQKERRPGAEQPLNQREASRTSGKSYGD